MMDSQQRLLHDAKDSLCVLDSAGRVKWTNAAFCQLFDVTHDVVMDQSADWLRSENCVLPSLDGTLPDGFLDSSFDTVLQTWTGIHLPVSLSILRLREENGDLLHALVIRDNRERRQAELLREQYQAGNWEMQAAMQRVLNHLELGVLAVDHRGELTFANSFIRSIFGDENLAGSGWRLQLHQGDEEGDWLWEQLTRDPGERQRVKLHRRDLHGRERVLEVDVIDDPDRPDFRIFICYDTTTLSHLRFRMREPVCFQSMVGRSEQMLAVFQQISKIGKFDINVLVQGETGTGKDLAAQAIHALSNRASGPFVAVNLAGIPETLVESLLFGHRRGSFTGAVDDSIGVFEAANGGTLFLDEICDVPAQVQVRLLRVLEEGEVLRIGDTTPRAVNVRVIAATQQSLSEAVKAGKFRPDLLYRLRICRITLPPLRERRIDIPLLADNFLLENRERLERDLLCIHPSAMSRMLAYPWPGNVRELRHAIEYAMLACQGKLIMARDLPPELLSYQVEDEVPEEERQDVMEGRRQRVLRVLAECEGNRSRAAESLKITRATLYRWLKQLNIGPKYGKP